MNFARQQEVLAQDTDLNQLLEQAIEAVQHQPTFGGVHIVRQLAGELPPLEADPAQLQQVFVNLLNNAAEAMPDGGTITVTTQSGEDATLQARIADTGCGIPRENLGRMFTPFFTTKAPGGGMGLGLSIVYGIIKMHRGQITVESEVGRGTTFTVTLPLRLARAERLQLAEADAMSAAALPRDSRILVIDDEEGIRQGCVRALGSQKFQVETAGTLAEGRRMIEQANFDLVLLDIMLPDGQGTSLLKTIRTRDAETVAVIITGFATVELAVDAIKQGAYDFISKPFDTDLLLMTVNQGLQKRRLSLETHRLLGLEQEAARLARDKQEMERLDQFKSAFMLTVAHELRSPVAAAQSLLRTMLRGLAGELNEQQQEILRRVEVRHGQLLELINDLLSLAASKTYDPGQPLQPVSLSLAVHRVIEAFAPQAHEKGVRIDPVNLTADLMVQASEDGLEQGAGQPGRQCGQVHPLRRRGQRSACGARATRPRFRLPTPASGSPLKSCPGWGRSSSGLRAPSRPRSPAPGWG